MTHKLRLPKYFSGAISVQMRELYASTAIADLAISLVMLFEPIFLYNVLKFTIPEVLLFFAATYALYIFFLPLGAKIVSRFGYEHGVMFSIPFQILYWFLLFGSKDNFTLIYYAPVVLAIEKSLFWPSFHSIVARFARAEQRGREFSLLYAIVNLVGIAGPLLGGIVSERYGLRATFIIASGVYFCSFLPLLLSKEIYTPKVYKFHDTWELYKTYPMKFLGYFGFGEEMLVLTVWPIFLFIVIADYQETGVIVTVATLVATVLALYIGKVSDKHSKIALLQSGSFVYALVWLARILVGTTFGALVVDSLSRTSKDTVFIPLSTVTYERAESTHILPYIIGFEQALSMGKFLAAIVGIIIFSVTGSFAALFVVGAIFSLLYMLV